MTQNTHAYFEDAAEKSMPDAIIHDVVEDILNTSPVDIESELGLMQSPRMEEFDAIVERINTMIEDVLYTGVINKAAAAESVDALPRNG